MTASAKQDSDFLVQVVGTSLLESSIEWIRSNLNPDQVWSEKELINWANNYDPEGIFSDQQLSSWAESNGYVKE